jgi:ABC-type multidrug transport system ATPase subunit
MLACDRIHYRYPDTDNIVFKELAFTIDGSGFHAFFGPSGVGKTSLAKIIVGQIDGFSGQVRTRAKGPLLYTYNLERLPGWSAVGTHLSKITPADRRQRCEDLVNAFGVADCMDQRFGQLSLGQKNRVNLIRYLLQDFDVLIMDESLANVDERTREKIIAKIKNTYPEAIFLYISHNVVEVSKFCRQIIVLRNAHKQPQAIPVSGCDLTGAVEPSKAALEQTMLGVMNAS